MRGLGTRNKYYIFPLYSIIEDNAKSDIRSTADEETLQIIYFADTFQDRKATFKSLIAFRQIGKESISICNVIYIMYKIVSYREKNKHRIS